MESDNSSEHGRSGEPSEQPQAVPLAPDGTTGTDLGTEVATDGGPEADAAAALAAAAAHRAQAEALSETTGELRLDPATLAALAGEPVPSRSAPLLTPLPGGAGPMGRIDGFEAVHSPP